MFRMIGLPTSPLLRSRRKEWSKVLSQSQDSLMEFDAYQSFWLSLRKGEHNELCTMFMAELVLKYLETDKQLEKKAAQKNGSEGMIEIERILLCLVHTLQYVDIFFSLDCESDIFLDTIKEWENYRLSASQNERSGLRREAWKRLSSVIQSIKRRHIDNRDKVDCADSILDCTFVENIDRSIKSSKHGNVSDQLGFCVLNDFPFLPKRLRSSLHFTLEAKAVFIAISKLLRAMPLHIRVKPNLAGTTLGNNLALLILLRDLLSSFPVADFSFLQQLLPILNIFKLWPKQYALIAHDLIKTIECEIEAPGSALRKRIFESNPALSPIGEQISKKQNKRDFMAWAETQSTVAVFLDSWMPRCAMLSQIFKFCESDLCFTDQTDQYKRQLLQSLLETGVSYESGSLCKNVFTEYGQEIKAALDEVNSEILSEWYRKARDDPSFRVGLLNRIIKKQDSYIVKRNIQIKDYESWTENFDEEESKLQTDSMLKRRKSEDSMQQDSFWLHTIPDQIPKRMEFPSIGQSFIDDGDNDQTSFGGIKNRKKQQIELPEEPLMCPGVGLYIDSGRDKFRLLELVQAAVLPDKLYHQSCPHQGNMKKRCIRHSEEGKGCFIPIVNVTIFGSNKVVHRFLCAYISLQAQYPDLCEKVRFKVYCIPCGQNDIASFIAQRDGWYRRHVYVPFVCQIPMRPQVKVSADIINFSELNDEKSDLANSSSEMMLRSLVDDYIAGAQQDLAIHLYECECWIMPPDQEADDVQDNNGSDSPYIKIPFCTRLDIGLQAAVARYKSEKVASMQISGSSSNEAKNAKGDRNGWGPIPMSLKEVLLDKNFVRSGIGPGMTSQLSTRLYYRTNQSNNEDEEELESSNFKSIELPESMYQSLSISNCPSFTIPTAENGFNVSRDSDQSPESVSNPLDNVLEISFIQAQKSGSGNGSSTGNGNGSISSLHSADLIKKKDLKPKDVDTLCDIMAGETSLEYAHAVEISSCGDIKPFDISLDGQVYGPFFRVRVRPMTSKLPLMGFFPLN